MERTLRAPKDLSTGNNTLAMQNPYGHTLNLIFARGPETADADGKEKAKSEKATYRHGTAWEGGSHHHRSRLKNMLVCFDSA